MIFIKNVLADSNLPDYGDVPFTYKNKPLGAVITGLLPYIYIIAGLILLVMLISGGIELMTSAGNPDKSKAGYGRITAALIGFLIIIMAYLVAKTVEKILGVSFM